MKIPKPRKLPSGSWFIQLRLNGVSVPVTAATERECRRQAELIKAEHRAGKREVAKAAADPTLRQAIDAYIEKRKNTLSPSTIDGYRRIQRNRFRAYMDRPLSGLKDWQRICDEEAKRCAPKTLRNAYRFIVSVLSENGVTVKKVTLPVMVPHTREWLDPEQITVLVESSRGTSAELPVLLALHSLRRSEMLALEWANIDLRRNTLRISGAIVQNESHGFVKKTANKNEMSTRIIPIMIPALREALEEVPQKQRQGPVITCSPHTVCNRINWACRRAGLPEVGTHGLRHSFASLAYHLGMSELETMEIGGWSDNQTMHKIYTHLSAADRVKAENRMAEFYKNANNNANNKV